MEDQNFDGYTLAAFSNYPIKKNDINNIDQIELANKMDIQDAFISYIDLENYKSIYEVYYPLLEDLEVGERRSIAIRIMEKIESKYEYVPIDKYSVTDRNISYIFDFIAFLEFNHIDLFATIWKELDTNILEVDILGFCFENKEQIINKIESNIDSFPFSKFITDFLKDAPLDILIKFFKEKSLNNKTEIRIKISELTQEENNE